MPALKELKIAIVGATGNVGRELLAALEENEFPQAEPVLLASEKSVGEGMAFRGIELDVEDLRSHDFKDTPIAIFCTKGDISNKYVPRALEAGAWVIDASSRYRGEADVPTVAMGLNDEDLKLAQKRHIVTLPHPIALTLAKVLRPLNAKDKVERVVLSTYQTVSARGIKALEKLAAESISLLGGGNNIVEDDEDADNFPHQYAFNVLPHVGTFQSSGETDVEEAIVADTARLLDVKTLPMSVTAVFVPTFVGEALSLNIEFAPTSTMTVDNIRKTLMGLEGIAVLDNPAQAEYATPYGAAETRFVFVSRVRADKSRPGAFNLWLVADHLRAAVASNMAQLAHQLAAQIAE